MSTVVSLILAAGRGHRFGRDKRTALMLDGRTMLETVLSVHVAALPRVFVVLRPEDAGLHAQALRQGASVLTCREADEGMGRSLACGMRALLGMPEVSGALIGMADMPWVSAATLRALTTALTEHARPVMPVYRGRPGQPRGLPRASFEALVGLHGDEGARALVDWSQAMEVPVEDAGVLRDVDTPADLAQGL